MGQLSTPYFQQWIVDAIEKEKMKKNHLQGVITHLESEVAGLSKETVEQMKASMKEVREGEEKDGPMERGRWASKLKSCDAACLCNV